MTEIIHQLGDELNKLDIEINKWVLCAEIIHQLGDELNKLEVEINRRVLCDSKINKK
ncbi:15630_t:CDS:2 [Entrophospora sp. SA101]|nr:15630_t:CDS:2 [Entrophospora sp. SA101]